MALTLKGQAGKALDATERTPALLKIRDLSLRNEVLADDVLTWTARTQDLAGSMTILPDSEQTVSLFENGTRIFHGLVTDPRHTMHGARVTVKGPWEWLRRIPLTTAGSAGNRPTMQLAQATVSANITTILTRAIALGAPIRIGTIASTFTIPKQQISEANFADALADQLKWITDGVGWWDYSGTGFPAFNLTRRAGAIDTIYTIGAAGNELTSFEDLTPQSELVASRVELTYWTRQSNGLPVQAMQAAGTAAPGKTQTIAISGPERDTFVPKDDLANFTIQTTDANATLNTIRPHIMGMLPEVIASRANFAGKPTGTEMTLANGETLTHNASNTLSGTNYVLPMPPLQFLDAATGAPGSRVGKHLVLTPDAPEWLSLPGLQRVKIVGRLYVLAAQAISKSATPSVVDAPTPPPAWANAFPWTAQAPMSWMTTTSFTQPSGYNRFRNDIWSLNFEIEAVLTTASYTAATTVYKPAEFDYLVPPAGMASALLAMQSWTPWKGTINRKGASCDGSQLLNRKFSLAGARSQLATMGALPKAVTYDFRAKTVTIELGAPSRHDTGSLAQRFRQPAQTNITYT
jgi:hypothetical protein